MPWNLKVLYLIVINLNIKENPMKTRRQVSATARKKHLKVQHHKVNSRRQFFYNQLLNHAVNQESSTQIKES